MDGDGFGSRSLYTSFGEKELVKIERRKGVGYQRFFLFFESSWVDKYPWDA